MDHHDQSLSITYADEHVPRLSSRVSGVRDRDREGVAERSRSLAEANPMLRLVVGVFGRIPFES